MIWKDEAGQITVFQTSFCRLIEDEIIAIPTRPNLFKEEIKSQLNYRLNSPITYFSLTSQDIVRNWWISFNEKMDRINEEKRNNLLSLKMEHFIRVHINTMM